MHAAVAAGAEKKFYERTDVISPLIFGKFFKVRVATLLIINRRSNFDSEY